MSESTDERQLLYECADVLERLLATPDLNLDNLEQATREAIVYAHFVLEQINTRRQAVYCVLCGELLPGMAFTEADRGQLIAYAHRECAEKATQSGEPSQQS